MVFFCETAEGVRVKDLPPQVIKTLKDLESKVMESTLLTPCSCRNDEIKVNAYTVALKQHILDLERELFSLRSLKLSSCKHCANSIDNQDRVIIDFTQCEDCNRNPGYTNNFKLRS